MEAEYLKESVGQALAAGLADVVLVQPQDPVGHLARYLLKYVDNIEKAAQVCMLAIVACCLARFACCTIRSGLARHQMDYTRCCSTRAYAMRVATLFECISSSVCLHCSTFHS